MAVRAGGAAVACTACLAGGTEFAGVAVAALSAALTQQRTGTFGALVTFCTLLQAGTHGAFLFASRAGGTAVAVAAGFAAFAENTRITFFTQAAVETDIHVTAYGAVSAIGTHQPVIALFAAPLASRAG